MISRRRTDHSTREVSRGGYRYRAPKRSGEGGDEHEGRGNDNVELGYSAGSTERIDI